MIEVTQVYQKSSGQRRTKKALVMLQNVTHIAELNGFTTLHLVNGGQLPVDETLEQLADIISRMDTQAAKRMSVRDLEKLADTWFDELRRLDSN